jgi:hypothetical protein
MATRKSSKPLAAQPLPMAPTLAKPMCCEEKYGITVRSNSRGCRRCPKVWNQR